MTDGSYGRIMEAPPGITAPLDPEYRPAALFNATYMAAVRQAGDAERVVIGVERENGQVARYETEISARIGEKTTRLYIERLVKFMLWSRGGWKLHVGVPASLGDFLAETYAGGGARAFDAELMQRVYERPFEVAVTPPEAVPGEQTSGVPLGGHLDGCRIGFDLGASDFKLAAVRNGEVVFSTEIPWNPKDQRDPMYHYRHLNDGLKLAASHLPRVDAIGGSTAGVVVDNRMMIASLFRSVPEADYETSRLLFLRLQREWQVPLEVLNDGIVTALAGSMSLGENGVLGIAMGSSEACGYIAKDGAIPGWLDELAFAPVDFNPLAAVDEWSGDRGVGAMYFSQQAVNRLAVTAGMTFADDLPLPERLKVVQGLMENGNVTAEAIFRTIGVYLGCTIPHYADFYDIRHVLVLGRVLSGTGGHVIIEEANRVLHDVFPLLAERITLNLPDEKSRRVGQAVAAASLPSTAGQRP